MTDRGALTVGLALPPACALSLSRALKGAGCRAEIASSRSMLLVLLREGHCRVWACDDSAEDYLTELRASGARLLALDVLPDSRDPAALDAWAQLLAQRLLELAGADDTPSSGPFPVWLLAGSAGATGAVQAFLNAFARVPPVSFLYAQHYDPDHQEQLEQLGPENPLFSMSIPGGGETLRPGHLFIVPPRHRITLDDSARLSVLGLGWGDRHAPDINAVIATLAASGLPAPGVILFSGMGDDGSAALAQLVAAGGRAWIQDPDSAVCAGMPMAALATGQVSRSGTPEQLASALHLLFPGEPVPASRK